MSRLIHTLLCLSLPACTNLAGVVPVLSLRAFTAWHQRSALPTRQRAQDIGLVLSLAWNQRRQRPLRVHPSLAFSNPWSEPVPCSDPALCNWAERAEQLELYAWGIDP